MRVIVLELVSTSNLAEINPLWNLFMIFLVPSYALISFIVLKKINEELAVGTVCWPISLSYKNYVGFGGNLTCGSI